VENSGIP
jgi:EF-hand domain-containing protein 1